MSTQILFNTDDHPFGHPTSTRATARATARAHGDDDPRVEPLHTEAIAAKIAKRIADVFGEYPGTELTGDQLDRLTYLLRQGGRHHA